MINATDYYPFGMPMPDRNGLAYQSTWVPGRGFVAGNSYPEYLQVNARLYAPTPSFYRAGKEVELLPNAVVRASPTQAMVCASLTISHTLYRLVATAIRSVPGK